MRSLAVLFLVVLGCAASGRAATSGPGLVVEDIGKGSALEKAGLRPGDLLSAWERFDARGEIRTVFDWLWIVAEQAPRGTVRLRGERDGVAITFEVRQGVWEARTRPRLAPEALAAYTEGRRRIEAGDLEGGSLLWDGLARGEPGLRAWSLRETAAAWSRIGQGDRARTALQTALAASPDPQSRVALGEALGESWLYANEMARAEDILRAALQTAEAAWGDSLASAGALARLGNVLRRRNRMDAAAELQNRAFEIRQRLAPDSLEVADSLHHLAGLAWVRGDLEAMAAQARRALAILERLAPDSPAMAETLSDLATVASNRGLAEEAEEKFRQALAILERRSPDSLQMATMLSNLGATLRQRGDPEEALDLHRRALAIREKLAPQSLGAATNLNNLGQLARDQGDLAAAEKYFQRAAAIWGKAAPQGLGVAGNLDELGTVARLRGDLAAAWDLHSRARTICESLSPTSLQMADTLSNLALTAEARGEPSRAQDLLQQSLALYERLSPGTFQEALALQHLAGLHRRARRLDQAADLLLRAIAALESQVEGIGASQNLRAAFRAEHEDIYRDAVEVELERGHAAAAFRLLERSRARSFLELLAERDLTFPGELPAALARSQRDNAARHDKALSELQRWTPAAGEAAREMLLSDLSRLHRERDNLAAEVRKASPRLAALRQPQPLDLAAARHALDPGTLALSYSVGKDHTLLFAVTREKGLRVEILPAGEERLRREVESFLEEVRAQKVPAALGRSLYRSLIAPVAGLVAASERVLILPDGPLHNLPFGALLRDLQGAPQDGQYLTEWKPFHSALSLTVYAALRSPLDQGAAGRPERAQLVAFGDPLYPARAAVPRTAELNLRGFNWAPLPYSRREVERIAAVYGQSSLYLGEQATEERAKSAVRGARVLHFATHGYLDDRTPLDSALVLTIPQEKPEGRDNGLLQVWEIFESVRLDADLVVLSACESARGRELSGEGLIGLTRAFQYAGARSVVATSWSVADQVTAELMVSFHRHLAAGLSKDKALRAAQTELIRKPIKITTTGGQVIETDASAPFFWAAFQLYGGWR